MYTCKLQKTGPKKGLTLKTMEQYLLKSLKRIHQKLLLLLIRQAYTSCA